jgi:hypothetical protein
MRRPSKKSLKHTIRLTLPDDDVAPISAAVKTAMKVQPPTAVASHRKQALSKSAQMEGKGQLRKSDVFDKLSKKLDKHAALLTEDDQTKEKALREKVVESLKGFKNDRINLGRQLLAYKSVFKYEGQWTRVVTEIGKVIDLSARTVFRIIEEYEHGGKPPDRVRKTRSSDIYGPPLEKEDKAEIRARLAIRSFLDDIAVNEKTDALASLLGEEVYQIWGFRDPFEIKITPNRSKFHIDGRMRISKDQAKEVAA